MISGLNASGIAGAIRSAGQARATMDAMARQIATGQKVASVRDDGAAWARAAELRGQKVQNQAREFGFDRVGSAMAFTEAAFERSRQLMEELKDIALQARQYAIGSSQRQALANEWAMIISSATSATQENPTFPTLDGYGVDGYELSAADPLLAGMRWQIYPWTNFIAGHLNTLDPPNIPVRLNSVNIATATDAQLADAFQGANFMAGNQDHRYASGWLTKVGHDQNTLDRMRGFVDADNRRLDGAISSLTDADLGAASAARARAETRQQLALSTVRQAISAYGSFAGGLLGNAQRTQRGVLA